MQTKTSEPNLLLKTQYSKRLTALLWVAYIFAGVGVVANDLPLVVKLGVLVGLVVYFFVSKLRPKLQTIEIVHNSQSGWIINGEPVVILGSSTLSQWAIFLQYKRPVNAVLSTRTAVIFCDALSEDDFRRLQVRLKTTFIDRQAMWVDSVS